MSCGGRGRGRGRGRGHHEHSHHGSPGFEEEVQSFTGMAQSFFQGMGVTQLTIPPEVSNPVIQPSIPYVGPIAGGIRPGTRLHVEGTVPHNAKQFQINFKTGVKDADDVAFHFNPRFGHYVYMNNFRNGKWQKEELGPDKPFVKGQLFKLLFLINKDSYEVHVNGMKFYTFSHRIPFDMVTTLGIVGDVTIYWLGFEKWEVPSLFKESKVIMMGIGGWTYIPLVVSHLTSNPAIPFVCEIPAGKKQDIAVLFQGTVPANANLFDINFKTGPAEGDDVAFHYNPRIGHHTSLNSVRNGNWETEETAPDKPFTRGGAFIILVVINSEGYEVYVNGLRHCTFKHRIPLEKVTTVNVGGNVSLLVCGFIDSWSTTSSFKELKKITTTQGPTSSLTYMPFEISHPVSSPALPYVTKIPGGLKQDTAVFLQGTVLADAKNFVFNFKTGPSDGDDIAFHYRPYFGYHIVLNSFRNGSWEKDETAPDKPFTKGGAFQMFVAVSSVGYEVYVNGLKQCTFKHRIPLEKVSVVHLSGDVSLLICGLIHKWKSPSWIIKEKKTLLMGSGSSTFIPLEISDPISNPAVPYVAKIPQEIKQDIAVVFQGTVPADATSFAINFKTGPAEGDDVAFHYNPRIGHHTSLNSVRNGNWETEETVTDKPFTRGGAFIILVVINSEGYEVYVNGFRHCTFKHRIPLEKVTTVNVGGNVSLLVCGFIDSWSTTSSFKEVKKITTTQGPTSSLTYMPFEISHPVSSPALPYVTNIPGGLKQDTAVFLQGTVLADAKNFVFNFKTGPSDGDDIAFHYRPYFGYHIVLNSFRKGSWEKEETAPVKPFTKGGAFQMFVAITSVGYEVYVNGLKQCTFKHRIPLEKVSVVHLSGDVSLLICGLIHKWKSPSWIIKEKKTLLMGSGSSTFIPLEISDPISNPAVPYVAKIPQEIKQDIAVVFQGTVPADATSFAINFKTGPADGDDVAFHYNPRIGHHTSLNSVRNGNWETEETVTDKPFTRGGAFIILVVINSEGYEVYVNGFRHCTFKHRIPLEKVTTVNVGGNVSLLVGGFIDSWSTTSSFKEVKKITTTQGPTSSLTYMPFEISHPVSSPALPYVTKIPGGLKQDTAVFLQGTVLADAKNFVFNFKTGPSDGDDIAFHYRPYFGYHIVLNSFRNGSWEKDETAPDKPFTKGGAFQMFVAVSSVGYEVYVNGLKQCTFKHRIPLEKVSVVHLSGDVSLLICGLIHKWKSPSWIIKEKKTLLMGSGSSTFIPLEISDPISNPAVPYVAKIPQEIKQDIAVVFQGTVPADATSFAINFKTGPAEGDDVAFHYNPRIGHHTSLNSVRNGNWETEETVTDKPFTRGGAFIILVVINSEGYEVYVNGLRHCTFKHRIPLEKVTTVNVGGNVSLLVCGFIDSWSTTSSFKEVKKITTTQGPTSSLTYMPFEISHPVSSPALPYVTKIPGGLKQDTAVFLQGTVLADAKNFVFNFKTGPSDGDDIAFHYRPNFGYHTALNSFRNGSWEKEETAPDKPFTKGGAFQMFVAVTSVGYEVYVNGLKQCTFKHRIPLEKVSVVHLSGDVSLLICGLIHKWKSPSWIIKEKKTLLMGSGSSTFIPLEISDPISNPAVPYVAKIPQEIKQDIAVVFQGTVPADATSFAINFKTGPAEGDDVAFHYNPRIGHHTSLNSVRNGNWETEETAPDKPFTRGGAFIILVVINSEGYEVYVNGFRHCTFKHRIPLEKVTTVNVGGNVSLLVCGFIDSWSTTSSFKEVKKITTTQGPTSSLTYMPFEISHPVSSPALPYVTKIPGGLKQDTAVFLQGTVLADAKNFVFNFKTGPSDGDDIAFHYRPNFGYHTALNSFRNGSWEKEETAPDKPFTKGGAFQMFVAVTSVGYEVYVNGLKQCTFKHRIPLEKVSVVHLSGDVSLLICGLIHKWKSPSWIIKEKKTLLMGSGSSTFIPLEISDPISNPAVPYVAKIPQEIKQDIAVVFQGTVPADATSFAINFKTGPAEGDDVAFHYNPRIGHHTSLNSVRNGNWETEETVTDKPFTRGGAFIILVVINSEGYEVYVNGLRHCTFKHRIPLEKVTTVNVGGNVSLLVCGFIDSWSTTSSFKEVKKITTTQGPTSSLTYMPFEISHPVSSPALPYVTKIPGGLKQDTAVFLQGTVLADAKNFVFNFKTGPSDGDDIAFHYRPNFGYHTALNSFRNGSWEKEETAPDKPFTKGGAFQMFVAVTSVGYEVYVNGLKQCTFKHRIPLEKVSVVHLSGDVSLLICGLIHKWKSPSWIIKEKKTLLMGSGSSTFIPLEISDPISNPAVPYVAKIPQEIKQDIAVVFQGTVPADATSFAINFKTGPAEGDDVAFHYNPRIGHHTSLNSVRNGNWETEETVTDKPFTRGGAFIILVVINSEGYEVYVNGFRHCTFKHRIPLEKVTTVNVGGNVSLLVCGFIDSWSTTSSFKEVKKITTTQGPTSSLTYLPLEISHPVIYPALPYVVKVPGGIHQDKAVFFQGTVPANAKGFEINFKTGPADGDDIAFHYNPRIGHHTALNSVRNGNWETEETAPDKPFTAGQTFQLIVAINPEAYEVYVNGLRHCTFKHRIPLEQVSTVSIGGDLSNIICGLIHSWRSSSFFTELQKIAITEGTPTSVETTALNISHPITNPALPYVGKIPGGIQKDMAVFFQGTIPQDAKGFEINFKTGPADGDDIAFHYNPRIGHKTALNSVRNGNWETEETAPDKPFTTGQTFQLIVVINTEAYEVYVNGLRHCTFKHRIPLEKVSTLGIRGDLSNLICGFIHSWTTSSFFTELQQFAITDSSSTALNISHPITNPALPYVGKIPGGIQKDMAVFFQGTIPQDAKGFEINFKTGPADGDDIAFHYNPRIGHQTTLNSVRNGNWGTEETAPDKPFTAGQTYQLIVVINTEGYEVYVNGLRHCTFKHRIPLEKVSTLGIRGDLSNLICGFIHSWTTSSFFTELQQFAITEGSSISVETTTLDISQPMTKPAIPFVGKIPGGFKSDMAIYFEGTTPQDAKGFGISFKMGPAEGDDVAFHYNPRIGHHTSLNSFRNGNWETEETAPDKPFTRGGAFVILVVINSEGYEVYVNGVKHCLFKHRISLEQVSILGIQGDVLISTFGFIYNWSSSPIYKEIQKIQSKKSTTSTTITLEISQSISNPAIPYAGKIPVVVKPNMAVLVQGNVLENAVSFEINFKTGPSDDIAFHFKPHIGDHTTLNSFRNGSWETPENVPIEPFTSRGAFQIIVVFKSEGYEVYVNGLKHCTFKHRVPLEKVSLIAINGDTTIQLIGFAENWSK
ncbi:uncharacterized protein LOC108264746 isoform X2 [Ictalurus punctatus]|uniref:Uncharacterized protein LOC108264746 isoform X2 n=1 Tax=Ictalurus punctatus TaxID=7998 RepID=A0A9F7REM3_ICTPU|nr:uncharacterized protein LOC108264746 isoform X2 [Ictalurus punctatus]